MNAKQLDRIKREVAEARRAPRNATALERLAGRLGRRLVKRGKHPMWESEMFNDLFALSIPHHGGKDLPTGTKNRILDQLGDDILAWEETLPRGEDDEEGHKNEGEDDDAG